MKNEDLDKVLVSLMPTFVATVLIQCKAVPAPTTREESDNIIRNIENLMIQWLGLPEVQALAEEYRQEIEYRDNNQPIVNCRVSTSLN